MAASALKELHPADGEDNTGCKCRAEQAAAAARSCCLLLVGTKVVCALQQAVREVKVKRGRVSGRGGRIHKSLPEPVIDETGLYPPKATEPMMRNFRTKKHRVAAQKQEAAVSATQRSRAIDTGVQFQRLQPYSLYRLQVSPVLKRVFKTRSKLNPRPYIIQ